MPCMESFITIETIALLACISAGDKYLIGNGGLLLGGAGKARRVGGWAVRVVLGYVTVVVSGWAKGEGLGFEGCRVVG